MKYAIARPIPVDNPANKLSKSAKDTLLGIGLLCPYLVLFSLHHVRPDIQELV